MKLSKIIILISCLMFFSTTSSGYAYTPLGFHFNGAVGYYNYRVTLPASFRAAVDNGAITTWNNGSPSHFAFGLNTSSANKVGYIRIDGFSWTLGETLVQTVYQNGHYHVSNVRMHLDSSEGNWYTGTTGTPSSSQRDAWSVIAHEFGHWLGLGESTRIINGFKPTMDPNTPQGQYFGRTLAQDDLDGIWSIYN